MFNEFADEKSISESLEFLANCDVENCDHNFHAHSRMMAFDVDEKDPEGLVVGDTMTAIAAGMSQANKNIVKDTLLLATMAADSKFSRERNGPAWYAEYTRVLAACGWWTPGWGRNRHQILHSRFTMDQVALEILGSAIAAAGLPGPTQLLMLKVAKDTVDALRRSDKPLRLFESYANRNSGAKFAIASSAESSDGEVVMALGTVSFSSQLNVTNVLFWEWSSSSVDTRAAHDVVNLNRRQYERARHIIEEKLDQMPFKALANLDF